MTLRKTVNVEELLKSLRRECRRAEKDWDWGREAGLDRAIVIVEWFASRGLDSAKLRIARTQVARTRATRRRSRK